MGTPPDIPDRSESGGLARYEGRHGWYGAAVLVALLGLVGRLWYLQVYRGDDYHRASTQNIVRNIELDPPRGRIIDRNGVAVAANRTAYNVVISPHIVREHDLDDVLSRLKRYLNLTDERVETLRERINEENQEITLSRDITRPQVASLETDKMRLPGVDIRVDSRRYYPLNSVMAHTVGFMGEIDREELSRLEKFGYSRGDYMGRMGLERAFEPILRGSPGLERQVVNARGIPQGETESRMLLGSYQQIDPIPGRDLMLTIDAELQLIIDEAMEGYPSGGVVAIDPDNGDVLALYSKPSFNPNSWSGRLSSLEKMRNDNDPFKPMLDKTVRPYFPGSVYKIVGSYAALDQGLAEPDDETHCPGYYVYGGRRFRCWKWGGHGDVDLAEALQHSCDVYFYKVAEEAGIDTLAEYAFKFGFGEKTGIPHNNESRGRVPTRKWHEKRSPNGYQHGFALNTVLGQGDTMATPLQVGLAYAAIANGGTIHYPRIVRQVQNGEGDVLYDFPSKVRKRVGLDDEQLRVIRKGLKQAVNTEGGTAYRVKLDDLAISGKTGTAQVHSIGRVRVPNRDKLFQLRDHAWFASYAPSDDPEIALVVFLEHAGHGGRQAAPVAAEVIRKYFDRDAKRSLAKKVDQQVRGGETDE